MVTKIQIVNTKVGDVLISGSGDGTLKLWDYKNEKQPHIFTFLHNVRSIIFCDFPFRKLFNLCMQLQLEI